MASHGFLLRANQFEGVWLGGWPGAGVSGAAAELTVSFHSRSPGDYSALGTTSRSLRWQPLAMEPANGLVAESTGSDASPAKPGERTRECERTTEDSMDYEGGSSALGSTAEARARPADTVEQFLESSAAGGGDALDGGLSGSPSAARDGESSEPGLVARVVSTCNQLEEEPWLPVRSIVTMFRVSVTCGEKSWELLRRYTEFHELDAQLANSFDPALLPSLPPKLLVNEDAAIAMRFMELDAYLRGLTAIPAICRNVKLQDFLGVEKHGARYGVRRYECARAADWPVSPRLLPARSRAPQQAPPTSSRADCTLAHAGTTRRRARATGTFATTTCEPCAQTRRDARGMARGGGHARAHVGRCGRRARLSGCVSLGCPPSRDGLRLRLGLYSMVGCPAVQPYAGAHHARGIRPSRGGRSSRDVTPTRPRTALSPLDFLSESQ